MAVKDANKVPEDDGLSAEDRSRAAMGKGPLVVADNAVEAVPPAPGTDPDSVIRDAKHAAAALRASAAADTTAGESQVRGRTAQPTGRATTAKANEEN